MPVHLLLINFRNSVLSIRVVSDDWLQATGVDSVWLSYDSHEFVLAFVFWYHHVWRRVVFFITHQNMWNKGTLTWQERNGHFHGLSMPVFWISPFKSLLVYLFFQLVKESILSAHAEVTNRQKAHFLEHKFPWELQLNGSVWKEILKCEGRNLHDVTDVETVYPFTLVQVS